MNRVVRVFVAVCILALAVSSIALAQTTKTASQIFLDYRAAFEKAKTVDEILPFMDKTTTDMIMKTPAAQRAQMFEMMKAMSDARNVKVVKETATPTGAQLEVEGVNAEKVKSTGTITMVKEAGVWKVGKEDWK